jgi:twitching motility protein PilT
MIAIQKLLEEMVERGATDLHLIAGAPPYFRINQELVAGDYEVLTPAMTRSLVYSLLNDSQKRRFEEELELDFAISIEGLSRFRGNAYIQRGSVACAIRRIPFNIPQLEELGLPDAVLAIPKKTQGFVLVTGPTGSGKSTTLAAIINRINYDRACHIITIEDPIEYLHKNRKAIVSQREVGQDTHSFAKALKYALREDPDVIMIGEMRDLETIAAALTAAETGHLVLATLHTDSAIESVNRIIDVFPPHQQGQVRMQLAQVLECVITQKLLPKANGDGIVLAAEVLVATPAVKTLIREARIHEVYGVMQTSQRFGMRTMNMSLYELVSKGLITWQTALFVSPNPEELKRMGKEITIG